MSGAELFSQVKEHISTGNDNAVVSLSKEILVSLPEDIDALKCLLISSLHLGDLDEAQSALDQLKAKGKEMEFEEIYLLYRHGLIEECLNRLTEKTDLSSRDRSLLAQVYYRLGHFEKSSEMYKRIEEENNDSEFLWENKCNEAASCTSSGDYKGAISVAEKSGTDVYEMKFIEGVALSEIKNWNSALQKLKEARDRCVNMMRRDGATEDEIEEEVSVIKVQEGFVRQQIGQTEEAKMLFKSVIDIDSDKNVNYLVALHNYALLLEGKELSEYSKKLRTKLNGFDTSKFSVKQRRAISLASVLSFLRAGKLENSREILHQIMNNGESDDEELLVTIEAAILFRERKFDECKKIISDYLEKNDGTTVRLTLAQLHIYRKEYEKAINVLLRASEDIHMRAGIVCILVKLFDLNGLLEDTVSFVQLVMDWWKNQLECGDGDIEEYKSILLFLGKHLLKNGMYANAGECLEELVNIDPNNVQFRALLATALCRVDVTRAEQVIQPLPDAPRDASRDVDDLENAPRVQLFSAKKPTEAVDDDNSLNVEKRKKKRKKRKRLPKNFDPEAEIDSERWLPMKDRSYYRKGYRKRARVTVHTTASAAGQPQNAEKQQAPAQKQKKKKKKGKGKKKW